MKGAIKGATEKLATVAVGVAAVTVSGLAMVSFAAAGVLRKKMPPLYR